GIAEVDAIFLQAPRLAADRFPQISEKPAEVGFLFEATAAADVEIVARVADEIEEILGRWHVHGVCHSSTAFSSTYLCPQHCSRDGSPPGMGTAPGGETGAPAEWKIANPPRRRISLPAHYRGNAVRSAFPGRSASLKTPAHTRWGRSPSSHTDW